MHGSILALVAAVAPLPPGVVAQIDGSAPVTKARFEHWLHVAAVSSGDRKAPERGPSTLGRRAPPGTGPRTAPADASGRAAPAERDQKPPIGAVAEQPRRVGAQAVGV